MIDMSETCNSTLERAQRRAAANKAVAEMRRDELCSHLRDVALNGCVSDGGPRYVLAQNVCAGADKPLWLFFCLVREGTQRLTFSGSRKPVEFSEADVITLSPLLDSFEGDVEFQPVALPWAGFSGCSDRLSNCEPALVESLFPCADDGIDWVQQFMRSGGNWVMVRRDVLPSGKPFFYCERPGRHSFAWCTFRKPMEYSIADVISLAPFFKVGLDKIELYAVGCVRAWARNGDEVNDLKSKRLARVGVINNGFHIEYSKLLNSVRGQYLTNFGHSHA